MISSSSAFEGPEVGLLSRAESHSSTRSLSPFKALRRARRASLSSISLRLGEDPAGGSGRPFE